MVFDPPYMHTPGGTAHDGHQNFEQYYKNNGEKLTALKYHEAVLDHMADQYFKEGCGGLASNIVDIVGREPEADPRRGRRAGRPIP